MTHADRRILRTRTSLRQALVELIAERDFASLSVQEIVDRANVGRSTFYAHYADKEELLADNLSALGAFAREAVSAQTPGPPALAFAHPLFGHVEQVRPMFAALLGRRSPAVVQEAFLDTVRQLLREHVGDEATVHFLAAGFLALARWWVLEAPELTAGEVYERYVRLASPSLEG